MKNTKQFKTVENRHNIEEVVSFSCEVIKSADTIKAVKKHRLSAMCEIAKAEMIEAHKVFNTKTNEYFHLSQELDSMEVQ